MNRYDFCCIGHITLDKVVTPKSAVHMPGGTSFYVSHAVRNLSDIDYSLLTAIGTSEMQVADDLKAMGINVTVFPCAHSVYFENIYGENQNNRTQRVLSKAAPFTVEQLKHVEAKIFHLGALLNDDFSLDIVRYLSGKGLVSVDSQGYLREVKDTDVYAVDWKGKQDAMKYIHFLKANEHEMEVLTGYPDVSSAAQKLSEWGIKEVLITLGSMGSVLYDGTAFYPIPAYMPKEIVDATGCGDTYMAGYLYQRAKGVGIEDAGRFAAALSTLKIERSGPVQATNTEVIRCMETADQQMPVWE
ncbi:MAG: PfkB family carbohydrate kinase [Tannerella sp.]|jgi:sugar/nucleoside kinase (ribokinase family)|nr:PfkB family carbohydrate kinase [Tannerella sp.]